MNLSSIHTPTPAATSSNSAPASSSNSSSSVDGLSSTFMSLLLAELKSQDPTSPMDTTAMVGQMVSLNQLNELMSIQSILQRSLGSGTTTPTSGATTPGGHAQLATSQMAATPAALSHAQPTHSLVGGTAAPITSTQFTNGAN